MVVAVVVAAPAGDQDDSDRMLLSRLPVILEPGTVVVVVVLDR